MPVRVHFPRVLLYVPMPCEVGAAALHSVLDPFTPIINMAIHEAKSTDATLEHIVEKTTTVTRRRRSPQNLEVIMIGTYWKSILPELMQRKPQWQFLIFSPSDCELPAAMDKSRVQIVNAQETKQGPANYLFEVASARCGTPLLCNLFRHNFQQVMDFIDDRCAFEKVDQTQPFFTGFFNTDTEVELTQRYIKLFSGEYKIQAILDLGNLVLQSQRTLIRERVIRNAKVVELQDGKKAVTVEAPELVNLTHEEVHRRFPDTPVTIVVNMKLPSNELVFSLRSFDGKSDVASLARKIGGDGKPNCAGGSIPFTCPVPF